MIISIADSMKKAVSRELDFSFEAPEIESLKEEGTTILVASHNPLDIEILCDEVYEMDAGAITKVH